MVEANPAQVEGDDWIGIDLGTSNSCVGYWNERGEVEILANPDSRNSRTTPSCVLYKRDGTIEVGQKAENLLAGYPKNTFYNVKRLIGRGFNEKEVQRDKELLPFEVVEGKNGRVEIKLETDNESKTILPQEVSAKVLEKMKECAERRTRRPVVNAVVTVPAYFTDQAKKATIEACKIAGLKCQKIMTEPTAAAIAYGINKPSPEEKFCVVYDFGGGTLDITVLKIKNREFHV